jgi:hypothetical protein
MLRPPVDDGILTVGAALSKRANLYDAWIC